MTRKHTSTPQYLNSGALPTPAYGITYFDIDFGTIERTAADVFQITPTLQQTSNPNTLVQHWLSPFQQTHAAVCVEHTNCNSLQVARAQLFTFRSSAAFSAPSACCQISGDPTNFSGRVDKLTCKDVQSKVQVMASAGGYPSMTQGCLTIPQTQ
jgi:hypothetical protein